MSRLIFIGAVAVTVIAWNIHPALGLIAVGELFKYCPTCWVKT